MVFLSHKGWGATQPLEVPALRALKGLWEQSSVCERLPIAPALANWLVLVLLALPHILYAFIWLLPRVWRNAFGKRAVDVLASLGGICKILQFSAIAGWCWAGRPTGLCFNAADVALWQWLAFLTLFSVGQSLNVAVFRTLGKYGVYYGYKLGHKIPYVYGYPFNFVSHPQYLGSVMTVWAFGALLHNQMPSGRVVLGSYWTLLYLLTAIQEDNF